jgi:hypothetical protein
MGNFKVMYLIFGKGHVNHYCCRLQFIDRLLILEGRGRTHAALVKVRCQANISNQCLKQATSSYCSLNNSLRYCASKSETKSEQKLGQVRHLKFDF